MAGDVTPDEPRPDMVRDYLTRLGAGLPAGAAADHALTEVEDGLRSAVEGRVRCGIDPELAAELAVAEFGDPSDLAAEFVPVLVADEAHRDGLALLTTGPLIGGAWLAAAILAWAAAPIAVGAGLILVGLVLATTVPRAAYAVAVTGRLGRGATRTSAPAAVSTVVRTVVALDAALLLVALPGLVLISHSLPMVAVAGTAAFLSLARLVTAARAGRRLDRSRALLTPT
jgi:hypothetical protein